MKCTIDGRVIGPGHPPYIIAEMSANHNGQLERALKTIDVAADCGADAVKLQTYVADTMTIDCDDSAFIIDAGPWAGWKLHDLYGWAQTPYEWHQTMFEHARRRGITIFSTPFDDTAVDLLESMDAPAYKVASFEAIDLPLIRRIAATGKPILISTGMAEEKEIEEAVHTAREAGCDELVLLHCLSSYPAPIEQANLLQIPELQRRFNIVPGLSDHSMGTTASIAAVALGACVIEKHFTLSREDKGPDSAFSMEPHELKTLCREARAAWSALGEISYGCRPAETASKIFRRSVYFVRDLAAGSVIGEEDIRRIRPGYGLAPKFFDDLIGKRVKVDVRRGMPTSWDLIDDN